MAGYMGEYGEGSLGIGFSHPSLVASASLADGTCPAGTETTASFDNNADYYQNGAGNYSQPVFVAAQMCKGKNSSEEPQIPYQQQQQQQLEKDAGLARSKAKDILRNIMHGIGSGSTSGRPPAFTEHNQTNENTGTITKSKSNITENQSNSYYGPHDGFTNTAHGPSNTAQIVHAPMPSASSIESDAQEARVKAMRILRKFQSQPNGDGNADVVGATTDRRSADQSITQLSSVSHYGPQEIHSERIDTRGVHLIPQQYDQHQHQHHPPQPVSSQPKSPIASSVIPTTIPIAITLPWELAKRRIECLEKDEERKQRALFKNFHYVARLEEERLAKQLENVQQVKTLEQQIDERYQQKIDHRMKKRNNISNGVNNINTSGAGIGTKQRNKAEAKRQRTALPPSLRKNHAKGNNRSGNNSNRNGKASSDSVAIYVSNLPTDGSVDEAMVQGLFAAYGSLRKVHFYVDKVTGRKKGDALVIYSLTEGEDNFSFTESVCSQINGCELPGGSVLRVEPSDPYHKVTAKTSKSGSQAEKQQQAKSSASALGRGENNLAGENIEDIFDHSTGNTAEKQPDESGDGADKEEDLDDFFASLE